MWEESLSSHPHNNTLNKHQQSHCFIHKHTGTEYLETVLRCEWDWCSVIIPLPSHTSSHPQSQGVGVSHHSYPCCHGGTPVHLNPLETLTQWLEKPFHQTLQTQRRVKWKTLKSLFISFPFFHQFFKSPCLINQMKWK